MSKLTIERLGHLGDGVANTPEGPVFVPFSLPGEQVEGDIVDGRMQGARVLQGSRDRVAPVCPRFGTCGGCSLQHASDDLLARWKGEIVQEALRAQGLESRMQPVVVSPANARRRATFAARRTKKGVLVGFHERASEAISGIGGCRLLCDDLLSALPALEDLCRAGASRQSVVSMAVTASGGGADVGVSGAKELSPGLMTAVTSIARKHRLARLVWNGEWVVTLDTPVQEFALLPVVPPPDAFLQPTREGQEALISAVLEIVGTGARHVVDLFAGCGTFTLPLARHSRVLAVESNAAALAALEVAARMSAGLKPVATATRDLFRRPLLPDELTRFDAAVIDPPRAGAAAQARALAASQVSRIAYVSCNPATFARDAAILIKGGYRLERVLPVDQFRWSPHVELVAQLNRT